jgi:hypothetical protein
MKIWVDDIRTPPDETWYWIKTSKKAMMFLEFLASKNACSEICRKEAFVELMSLDHDLGGDDTTRPIVLWMIENDFWPVEVRVHSANPPGAYWLESMIERYHPSNAHRYTH